MPNGVKSLSGKWDGATATATAKWTHKESLWKNVIAGTRSIFVSLLTSTDGKKFTSYGHDTFNTSSTTSYSKAIGRSGYYPLSKTKLMKIRVSTNVYARIGNKDNYYYDELVIVSFSTPREPTISASFNASNGTVTFRIKTNAGNDSRDRYDTRYRVLRQDSANRNNEYKNWKTVTDWVTNTSTDLTTSYDVFVHQTITQSQWISLKCEAYARGLAGDSKTVSSTYLIAHPASATIGKITCTTDANGTVTIPINTNKSNTRPVTQVKLYRLTNTTIGTAAAAAAVQLSSWDEVDNAVDDAECSGFTDQKSAAMPEVRKHTWYRVVSTYGANTVEGMPVEATCLYRARDASSAQSVKYRSVELGEDGTSVLTKLGWATDNYNAVQMTWSDHEDAWESSDQPNSYIMDWEDATAATGYAHSANFTIRGIESGSPVYIRARRVLVVDDKVTQRGEWCTPSSAYYPIYPAEGIATATLFAPAWVQEGRGIECSWTLTGAAQDGWQLKRVNGSKTTLLARGSGTTARYTIPYSKFSGAESVTLFVSVRSGAEWLDSSTVTVGVAEAPTLSVSAISTLGAQPLEVTLASNSDVANVRMGVTAAGTVVGTEPDGGGNQVEGDVLWSDVLSPTWTAATSGYTTTVELPDGLAFIDNAEYIIRVVAFDPTTALESDESSQTFDVEWDHQAAAPDASSTVVPDSDELSCTITPIAPPESYVLTEDSSVTSGKTYYTRSGSGTEESPYVFTPVESPSEASLSTYYELAYGDVCDVWRVSSGGAALIAESVEFGTGVVDRYAPYSALGPMSYRLVTRTVDGDTSWADFGYELEPVGIRIDWDDGSVDLPWSLAGTDAYAKSFELSSRWDGSRVGRWNQGAAHTANFDSDVIAVDSETQGPLLRQLASHDGPCFVRTPDGMAFAADVQVESYGSRYGSAAVPVSIRATECDAAGQFMAVPEEEEEDA